MKSKKYYVDKEKLLNAYIKWINENDYKSYEYIGKCILEIAKHISESKNFSKYSYKDEMISYACFCCTKAIKNINLSKSNNLFAYFSQICFMAFKCVINQEKKNIKKRRLKK